MPYDKAKNIPAAEVTPEMKEAWSRQFGEGRCAVIRSGDKVCYLKPPSRTDVGAYGVAFRTNGVKANEFLLKQCWLAGDPEFIEEDKYFYSAVEHLPGLIQAKEAEVENF